MKSGTLEGGKLVEEEKGDIIEVREAFINQFFGSESTSFCGLLDPDPHHFAVCWIRIHHDIMDTESNQLMRMCFCPKVNLFLELCYIFERFNRTLFVKD